MKKACVIAFALLSIVSNAQDYQIGFAVYGDTEIAPDSVVVYNIDQDHTLTLSGEDILHLVASTTGVDDLETAGDQVEIYPNPFSNKATVLFPNDRGGEVRVSLFDISGRLVAEKSLLQSSGKSTAEVKGLPPGAYVLHIETESSTYSKVILSYNGSGNHPDISFTASEKVDNALVSHLKSSTKAKGLVEMLYNEGDSISFTAYLGDLQSEVRMMPIASTTLTFDFQDDREDIMASADISREGGVLRVIDESGNVITVTFPPGTVQDTVTVSLTLLGDYKNLTIDERQLRTFEIRPLDIKLYQPVLVSVNYHAPVDELQQVSLFHVQDGSILIPLSEHFYVEDSVSITARAFHLGEFAEGKMSLGQINAQFDLLLSKLGITWTLAAKAVGMEKHLFSNGMNIKGTWDGWKMVTGGLLTFFNLKELHGFYDSGQASREEDQEKLCEKIMDVAVKEVLDLGIPDDPCDPDYTYTLLSMIQDMELHGCEGTPEYERLKERYDQALVGCGTFPVTPESFPGNYSTYLQMELLLTIEETGFVMINSGNIPISVTLDSTNNGTVEGFGTLEAGGWAYAGGPCSGVITGETVVNVAGSRDSTDTFVLTLNTYQMALLTTTCPDGYTKETPLTGPGTLDVNLSLGNQFTFTKSETLEGGQYVSTVILMFPYNNLPPED